MSSVKKKNSISISIDSQFPGIDVDTAKIKKLIKAVCRLFKIDKAAVNVIIADDVEIIRVNRKFLHRRHATDCISFDLSDEPDVLKIFDIIVNGQRAVREAQHRGHPAHAELALYITHGLLHNIGFDDSTASKAKKMHDTEDKILQQMGYGIIYG